MRHHVLLATTLVMAALAGCADTDGAPAGDVSGPSNLPKQSAGEARIVGTVTDDAMLPLAGVQVGIVDPPASARTTTTDESGAYAFTELAPGEYRLAVGKLGYEGSTRGVRAPAGEETVVDFTLKPVEVRDAPYHVTLIGDGYIACGLYAVVVTVSNLNVCAWDTNHKPRFEFEVPGENLMGVLQEVVWDKSSAVTSERLIVYLWYNPTCEPTCSGEREYAESNAASPVRQYSDLSAEDFPLDPVPLASLTFVGGDGVELVFVFQQKITHYVTAFYNEEGDMESFTAMPE